MKTKSAINVNRRRAVMGSAAGVALAAWHKPVIEAVMLPAHAQASASLVFFIAGVDAGPLVVQNKGLLDWIVPQAYAVDVQEPTATLTLRAEDISGDLSRFDVGLFTSVTGVEGFEVVETVHSGEVSVASGGTLQPTQTPCDALETDDIDVEVITVDGSVFSLRLLGQDFEVVAPAEDMPLPTPVCTPRSFGDFAYFDMYEMTKSAPLLDLLVPQAVAGAENGMAIITTDNVIAINSGDNINFTVTYQNGINRWTGSLSANNPDPAPLSVVAPICGEPPSTIDARIADVDQFEMQLGVNSPTNPMATFYLDREIDPVLPALDECVFDQG